MVTSRFVPLIRQNMHFQINPLAYNQTYTAALSPFYKGGGGGGGLAGMGRLFLGFLLTNTFGNADLRPHHSAELLSKI